MKVRLTTVMRLAVHIGALVPLAVIIWDLTHGNLSANPIQDVQLRTGAAAIDLLMLSLFCTPVFILTGFRRVMAHTMPHAWRITPLSCAR